MKPSIIFSMLTAVLMFICIGPPLAQANPEAPPLTHIDVDVYQVSFTDVITIDQMFVVDYDAAEPEVCLEVIDVDYSSTGLILEADSPRAGPSIPIQNKAALCQTKRLRHLLKQKRPPQESISAPNINEACLLAIKYINPKTGIPIKRLRQW